MDDWLSTNHKSLNVFSVPLIVINAITRFSFGSCNRTSIVVKFRLLL